MFTLIIKSIFMVIFSIYAAFGADKITYFAFERAQVHYHHPTLVPYVNISTTRYSRRDPVYYFNCHFYANSPFGNNVTFLFDFHQFLSNTYKPSFVQFSGGLCYLLTHPILSPMIRDAFFAGFPPGMKRGCPFPKGPYHLSNMTLKSIPNFPFKKGRVYGNLTLVPRKITVFYGSVDFEIREVKTKI